MRAREQEVGIISRVVRGLLPMGSQTNPDPAPWEGVVWGALADLRMLLTDCARSSRNRMSELLLFRENMRFRHEP